MGLCSSALVNLELLFGQCPTCTRIHFSAEASFGEFQCTLMGTGLLPFGVVSVR